MSKSSVARQRIAQINGVGHEVLTEAFTKQHYIAIAGILKSTDNKQEIAAALADLFAKDNSAFNRSQFLKACGMYL